MANEVRTRNFPSQAQTLGATRYNHGAAGHTWADALVACVDAVARRGATMIDRIEQEVV